MSRIVPWRIRDGRGWQGKGTDGFPDGFPDGFSLFLAPGVTGVSEKYGCIGRKFATDFDRDLQKNNVTTILAFDCFD